MTKKKTLIVVLSALIVVAIAAAAILAMTLGGEKTYTDYIESGDRFLENQEYDKALSAYQSALDLDEKGVEGYEGLTRVYLATNRESLALRTLETGIRLTNSSYLQGLRPILFPDLAIETPEETNAVDGDTAEVKVSEVKPVLNESLLSFISGACYSDYKERYGIASVDYAAGVSTDVVEGIDVTLTYTNSGTQKVINESTGEPYNEFFPDKVAVNQLALLFGGAEVLSYSDLEAMTNISGLTQAENTISFEAYGCRVTVSCDGNGQITADSWNEVVPLENVSTVANIKLSGNVLDATTGLTVSGVEIKAYAGYGAYGTPVTATSGSNGSYSMELPAGGTYTVVVEKLGYITGEFSIYVLSNGNTTNEDFVISPEMAAGQMRIVLTWGSSPTDLDSYLMGTSDSGSSVDTNYMNKVAYAGDGTKLAELDVDDVDGYGPETTTIYDINGVYEFAVVDFTGSGTMSYSGAKVTVYSGNSVVATVDICSGLENGWMVCKIDHGNVTVVNSSAPTSPASPK